MLLEEVAFVVRDQVLDVVVLPDHSHDVLPELAERLVVLEQAHDGVGHGDEAE